MTNTEYITRIDALKILGWINTPKSGDLKIRALIRGGELTKPNHAPRMLIKSEVENIAARLGNDIFFNNVTCKLIKAA